MSKLLDELVPPLLVLVLPSTVPVTVSLKVVVRLSSTVSVVTVVMTLSTHSFSTTLVCVRLSVRPWLVSPVTLTSVLPPVAGVLEV